MKLNYSVTFEFDIDPPLTRRGSVEASHLGACARRAVENANRALKPKRWRSFVLCALERLPANADGL